ncbi:MAG TPA: hypothetical protein VFV49_10745 [Thermoanaerobaculia bacterium]|nr:hypothetical protein [Thermoanaerobaculia bacterium]
MTDHPTPESQQAGEPEPGAAMPRWVPVLIGGVLVIMAGLAVYTGIRYRDDDTLVGRIQPSRRERVTTPAPPGEPDAGASRVMHGSEGDNIPSANEPVEGSARAVISGGPGGIETTVRIWARRGMLLQITPAESMVYVNDTLVGHASQFDTEDEIYDFPAPGSYTIKVVAPNTRQKVFIVTAADDAKQDVAHIKAAL